VRICQRENPSRELRELVKNLPRLVTKQTALEGFEKNPETSTGPAKETNGVNIPIPVS